MKPQVNGDLCIGCGMCASMCPEVFIMSDDGKAEVIAGANYAAFADTMKEAVESCPTKAISA